MFVTLKIVEILSTSVILMIDSESISIDVLVPAQQGENLNHFAWTEVMLIFEDKLYKQ